MDTSGLRQFGSLDVLCLQESRSIGPCRGKLNHTQQHRIPSEVILYIAVGLDNFLGCDLLLCET